MAVNFSQKIPGDQAGVAGIGDIADAAVGIGANSCGRMGQFLDSFSTMHDSWRYEEIKRIERFFERFKGARSIIAERASDLEAREASTFNLFRVLGVRSNEVRHSAFLAALLDPAGSHGQGDLFLRHFLELCRSKNAAFAALPVKTAGRWIVDTEWDTKGHGRMDIVLFCRSLGFLAVIENKIYAQEQDVQLSRYAEWLHHGELSSASQKMLIYLTLDGKLSATDNGAEYIRMSYANDVVQILMSTLSSIKASHVKRAVEDYLAIVESLCKEIVVEEDVT